MTTFPYIRIGIRLKLLFLSSFLFAIPWLGYQYIWEVEKYLRKGQEQTLTGTVTAIATALHERPKLFNAQASFLSSVRKGRDLHALDVGQAIRLDGDLNEWQNFQYTPYFYGDDYVFVNKETYSADTLSYHHMVVKYDRHLYAMFEVTDNRIVYRGENATSVHKNDHLQIGLLNKDNQFRRFIVAAHQPGWFNAYLLEPVENSVFPLKNETKIQGTWKETKQGYNIELRMPLDMIGSKLGFIIYDVDDKYEKNVVTAVGTSNTQRSDQLGTVLVPSPEIEKIIKGLSRSNLRIWVIDKHRRVQARIGDIRSTSQKNFSNDIADNKFSRWWQTFEKKYLHPLYYRLLTRPPQDFIDELERATQIVGSQIDSALEGTVDSTWYLTPDKKAVVLSAAHPVWVDDEVMGVVVAEETTNGIRTIRNQALEKLFSVILLVMTIGILTLFLFASRISSRIRKLRTQAEQAIDEQGRVSAPLKVLTYKTKLVISHAASPTLLANSANTTII